jgi:acyl-CoA dehydrogenase family protein 9
VVELSAATDAAIMAHKKQLIDRQMLVERLSNMAIELYARACVLSRTQRLLRERGVEAITRELNLCDLFCVQSGRRFRENRESLQSPQDALRRTIAADLRASGGAFVPDSVLEVALPVTREPVVPMRLQPAEEAISR